MKKILQSIFIVVVFSSYIFGQGVYFNRKYNIGTCNTDAGILTKNSGYITIGDKWDSVCRHGSVTLLFLDSVGNNISVKTYGINKYFNYGIGFGSLINTKDSGYAACGWVNDTTYISAFMAYDQDITLWKFNANGDTSWVKKYTDTNSYANANQCKQTKDGGYIITGTFVAKSNPAISLLFLLKTDSIGNVLWQKTYNYSTGIYKLTEGYTITITLDGGFLIGGYCGSSSITKFSSFILKTDTAGNVKWESTISNEGAAFITSTPDSGGIVACPYATNSQPLNQLYVLKYNPSGGLQWQKKYGVSVSGNAPWTINFLPDSNFIITGNTSTDSSKHIVGFVTKIDWIGNMKWYGTYDIYKDTLDQNYLRDIKPTPDGGYVACGFAWPYLSSNGNEDFWVLKLDSNGCDSIGHCPEVNTGENEVKVEEEMVKVYPNPTSGRVQLIINNEQLINNQIDISAPLNIEVYNVFGQCVYSSYKLSAMSYELDLSGQPNGVYFYRVIKMDEVASPSLAMTVGTGKIVIEK